MAFELTMQDARASRRGPWQLSTDGGRAWWPLTIDAGRRLILGARLPIDRVELVMEGGTVQLPDGRLIRRRPSAVEVDTYSRQLGLWSAAG